MNGSTAPISGELGSEPLSESEEKAEINTRKRSWARLLAKVCEVDPRVCPKCGVEMKVIAVIKITTKSIVYFDIWSKTNGRHPFLADSHS